MGWGGLISKGAEGVWLSESPCGPQSEQLHTLSVSLRWCLSSSTTTHPHAPAPECTRIPRSSHHAKATASRPTDCGRALCVRFRCSCALLPLLFHQHRTSQHHTAEHASHVQSTQPLYASHRTFFFILLLTSLHWEVDVNLKESLGTL